MDLSILNTRLILREREREREREILW